MKIKFVFYLFNFLLTKYIHSQEILYNSERITPEKPIVVKDYVFYSTDHKIFSLSLESYYKREMYGNSIIKPLRHLSSGKWGDVVFFTKDCILKIFKNKGEDTLKGSILYSNRFSSLEGEHCYLTLDIDFNEAIHYIAAYNRLFNKIIVYPFNDLNKNNNEEKNVIEFETETNICQALLYNNGAKDIILIGITREKIYFWILKGIYSFKDLFVSNRQIFNIESYFDCMEKGTAGIINSNQLLYIRDSVYLFDLNNLQITSKLNIENPSALTVFNDWKALVGTESGYIYLIICRDKKIKSHRKYKVCEGEVLNISYDNGYYYNNQNYYTNFKFAIQCREKKGIYFHIFMLDQGGITDL